MKTFNRLLAALAFAACANVALASTQPAEPLVSLPTDTLTWKEVPGTHGAVIYANTEGDILSDGKGFYSAFVRFKAGTDNGLHRHTEALPTMVMAGTFYARIDGKLIEYPAGSYYRLPAGMVHESGCKAGDDCLLFQYQDNNFDLVPVTP